MPDYHKLKPDQLIAFATSMGATIGDESPNPFGVPLTEITALTTGNTGLTTALATVATAKANLKSQVDIKNAKDKALVGAISQIAKTCYANPAVTDAMLLSLGLPPRTRSHAAVPPTVPLNLVANPHVDGTVNLKWARNGNTSGTSFIIESQTGEGEWTFVGAVTSVRAKLEGYTPGVNVNFRVKASKKGVQSPASNIASIYQIAPTASLKIAA